MSSIVFEILFNYSPTVFREGEFLWASGWPVWLLISLILAVASGIVWQIGRSSKFGDLRKEQIIGALQVSTVALMLIMLWRPAVSIDSLRPQQNVVAVLLDTSHSMTLGKKEGIRLKKAQKIFSYSKKNIVNCFHLSKN